MEISSRTGAVISNNNSVALQRLQPTSDGAIAVDGRDLCNWVKSAYIVAYREPHLRLLSLSAPANALRAW